MRHSTCGRSPTIRRSSKQLKKTLGELSSKQLRLSPKPRRSSLLCLQVKAGNEYRFAAGLSLRELPAAGASGLCSSPPIAQLLVRERDFALRVAEESRAISLPE
jgi:hypothetical protein